MEQGRIKPATLAAQALHYIDPATGGLVPPIQPSTTFARTPDYALINPAHTYGRADISGYLQVEAVLCALEGGSEALVFPSGMAAIAALFRTLRRGQAIVAQRPIYYGTLAWLAKFCAQREIALHHFDGSDPASLERVVRDAKPAIVWIETPSNPMLDVIDIARAAEVAHAAGALLAVDSTAATPVLTRPLALGADVVMHSATKYLNGHSDVLAGVLVTGRTDARWAAIKAERHDAGALLGPFEAWLLLRGLRTLALRVRQASENALAVAHFLETHPSIDRVLYPGLPGHPQHALARRQMDGGFGGLLSFLVTGDAATALAVAGRLRLIARATSLGGTESLIEHRFTIEGAANEVPPNLLRLSVGIEDATDLIADLAQALDREGCTS
ncbi:MAG: trans-sulfuration enzyme family protein [Geminicoccaceae bacterium]